MNLLFLKEYVRDIRRVGAVAPSSKYLAKKMVDGINFDTVKVILEYGPGTGMFTAELVKHMKPHTTLLVIETNKAFYDLLKRKYKDVQNVEILLASAENAALLHAQRNLPAPDYIISGLPFAALPVGVSQNILEATVKMLGRDGVFITFQYTLLKHAFFKSYFKNVRISREFRNIPPAYIISCSH